MSKEQTELEKMIDKVDQSFAGSKRSFIQSLVSIILLGIAGAIAVGLAIDLALLASLAARVGLVDTVISLLALAVATGALGLSLLTTASTLDWGKKRRAIDQRHHYGRLKVCGYDSLTLQALIKMRAMLPKDVTLKQTKTANPDLFNEKEFARRLLE